MRIRPEMRVFYARHGCGLRLRADARPRARRPTPAGISPIRAPHEPTTRFGDGGRAAGCARGRAGGRDLKQPVESLAWSWPDRPGCLAGRVTEGASRNSRFSICPRSPRERPPPMRGRPRSRLPGPPTVRLSPLCWPSHHNMPRIARRRQPPVVIGQVARGHPPTMRIRCGGIMSARTIAPLVVAETVGTPGHPVFRVGSTWVCGRAPGTDMATAPRACAVYHGAPERQLSAGRAGTDGYFGERVRRHPGARHPRAGTHGAGLDSGLQPLWRRSWPRIYGLPYAFRVANFFRARPCWNRRCRSNRRGTFQPSKHLNTARIMTYMARPRRLARRADRCRSALVLRSSQAARTSAPRSGPGRPRQACRARPMMSNRPPRKKEGSPLRRRSWPQGGNRRCPCSPTGSAATVRDRLRAIIDPSSLTN